MSDLDTDISAETSTDIGSQLAAAFDGATSSEDHSTPATATARETVSGEQSTSTSVASLEAPKHWTEADKALFATAPRDIQQRWINRETETQRGLDTKFQEIAGFKRERDQLDELFRPFARDLELQGMNRLQMMQSLLGAHKYLQESPADAIRWICQQYQIDPSALNAQEDQTDPRYAQLEKRYQELHGTLNGFLNSQQQTQQQQNLSRVQTFAEAKGEDGKPLHPYFDEVAGDIIALMKAGERDLEKVYTKAVRMNDAVFEKVQAEKKLSTKQNEDRERMATINKAKRAAVGNEGPQPKGPNKPRSLDEELRSAFDSWSGS